MDEIQIDKIIRVNERALLLLGYASSLLYQFVKGVPECHKEQYYWFKEALENILCLDIAFPPVP